MKLVTYNIQYGVGFDRSVDIGRIAASVAEADIIALQEVTRGYPANGGIDMVAELARSLPGHFHVFGPAMDVDMGSHHDETGAAVERRLHFGNMVLSRYPIVAARSLLLPRSRTFEELNLQRGAMEALIAAPGGALRVYSVHLDHIHTDERLQQVEWLRRKALAYSREGGAITGAGALGYPEPPHPDDFVLMGDFNMEPETPEYRAMVGASDPQKGRPRRAGLPVDAVASMAPHAPDAYTWRDMKDPGRRKQLDYCFVSPLLAARIRTPNGIVDL